jgi:hypothetical protein
VIEALSVSSTPSIPSTAAHADVPR